MVSSSIILQEHRIRPSLQRRIVFDYLLASESHPSVDTIYSDLLPANPGLSRTTVYNTLELLQKHGLVKVLDFGEGFLRYDGKITPHCHFRCEKCGAIYDIAKIPEGCEKFAPAGSRLTGMELYLNGICPACNK